jgi:hypothetical protein
MLLRLRTITTSQNALGARIDNYPQSNAKRKLIMKDGKLASFSGNRLYELILTDIS